MWFEGCFRYKGKSRGLHCQGWGQLLAKHAIPARRSSDYSWKERRTIDHRGRKSDSLSGNKLYSLILNLAQLICSGSGKPCPTITTFCKGREFPVCNIFHRMWGKPSINAISSSVIPILRHCEPVSSPSLRAVGEVPSLGRESSWSGTISLSLHFL